MSGELQLPFFEHADADRSWAADAACRGLETSFFFPERGDSTSSVKAVCRECPVKGECLRYALESREKFGTWGGASENDRRRMQSAIGKGITTIDDLVEASTHDDIVHATVAGYRKHARRNERPCHLCAQAMAVYKRQLQLKQRQAS